MQDILSQKVDRDLSGKVPEGFEVAGNSRKTMETISFSKESGDSGQEFSASAKMNIEAFVIKSDHLQDLVSNVAAGSLPSDIREAEDLRSIKYSIVEADPYNEVIQGRIDVQTKILYEFNKEEMSASLKRKDNKEVRAILYEDQRIMKAMISFWPIWVKKVPNKSSKITIEVVLPEE